VRGREEGFPGSGFGHRGRVRSAWVSECLSEEEERAKTKKNLPLPSFTARIWFAGRPGNKGRSMTDPVNEAVRMAFREDQEDLSAFYERVKEPYEKEWEENRKD
jgi:hypothetical protein